MNDTGSARGLGIGMIIAGCVALATCATLAEPPPPQKPETMTMKVLGAHDADTLYSRLDGVPDALSRVSIRLEGVDTPERGGRAKCEAERDLADRAHAYVLHRIGPIETVTVVSPRWGKFGGRVLGRVLIGGADLSADLIRLGFGRPYDGGAREGWCDAETRGRDG